MTITLLQEQQPSWTAQKKDLFRLYPGAFELICEDDQPLEDMWFEVKENGSFAGFVRLIDTDNNGTVEVQICVLNPAHGVGTVALTLIQEKARQLGFSAMFGVILGENDEKERIAAWLKRNCFTAEVPSGWTEANLISSGQNLTFRKFL